MRSTQGGGGTGQTSVDFLIGFSIFAMTLLFVLQMATGSVVNTASESYAQDAISERTGAVLISNWSEGTGSEREINETNVKNHLDRSPEEFAEDLNIPEEYSYNVSVVTVENVSTTNVTEVEGFRLTAGDNRQESPVGKVSGERRVAHMLNDTDNSDSTPDRMVAVEVEVW